jgi:hypothetical protein
MLSALLSDGKELIPIKRYIIERTEGTPFFMEEIVQALFEDGVLQRNGTVKLIRSMNAVKVPPTVQAVLASHRPSADGGEGITADPGRTLTRISAQTGAARDPKAGGGAYARSSSPVRMAP